MVTQRVLKSWGILPKCLGLILEENYPKDQAATADTDISEIAHSFEKMLGSTDLSGNLNSIYDSRTSSYSNPLGYRTSIRPKLLIAEDNTFTVLSFIRWNSTSNDDVMLNRIRFFVS